MRSMRLFLLLGCVNALSFVPNSGLADAEEDIASSRHRDRAALSDIFEERVLQDNFAAICESVKALPAERRYHFLTNWVLPDSHRSAFRLPMSFQPPATDSGDSLSDSESQLPPVSAVVVVKSPAIDLVLAASESGKLSELRDRVISILPGDPVDQRCRETLLILMDIEGVNFESARKRLADVLAGLQKLNRNQLAMRCPETLAAYQGMQHDTTRDISAEILSFLLDSLVRVDRISSTDPCDRAIASLAGWAQAQNVAKSQTQNGQSQIRLTQWSPVSRITHRTLGSGFPAAHWAGTRGGVNNVSSHDEDYLYFQSPLLGDFEVECDVTSVQWQHSHLMVCGNWIAPVRGRSEVEVGNFQRLLENVVIDPPLSPLEEWIHYRTVVRRGTRSTFINGRLVDEQPLPKDHDPWLAIRSPWYADGGVRNLRITGKPEIPETVSLAPQPGLDQWIPGFDAVIGHDWLQVSDPGGVQIVGVKRNSQLSGTFCESVLQYHRPMLEDGTFEYEFLYEADRSHVHPSLDGLAFLFLPDGVSLHQMTHGVYDRTTADPTTIEIEPATRRGPQHLPLKPMAWNQVQLKLSGNLVQLSLNGQVVLERTLEPNNLRRFGLFHFADQTQATVRNIRWSGSWPRTLPLESEQELADPEQPFPELTGAHVFRHDFTKQGAPPELFTIYGVLPGGSTADAKPDGLSIQCHGKVGCIMCEISPNLVVEGDFDFTATFERLITVGDINCSSGVFLKAFVNSSPNTHCSVYRGLIRNPGEPARQLTLTEVANITSDGSRLSWSRPLIEESSSGRLRMMRRGKRILFLFAEGDSSQFRLVSREQMSDSPLTVNGVHLIAMCHESTGRTDVVWKNIEIRATKLTGPAMENRPEVVEELNRLRDQLPDSLVHDFTTTAPDVKTFFRWRDDRPWDKSAGGLRIVAKGANSWLTSGFNIHRAITGDFDFVVPVKELKLPTPVAGLVSGIYLVIPVSDKDNTHATLHFRKVEDGRTVIVVGTGKIIAGAMTLETVRTIDSKSVSALRVTRHKGTLTCLVSSPDFDRDQIIATIDFPEAPIRSAGLQINLHAGGTGLESEVVIPRIDIRATKITKE